MEQDNGSKETKAAPDKGAAGIQPQSPREKRPCPEGAQSAPGAPTTASTFPGFMVAASPPEFVAIEDIMKAASGVSNMILAHEIAVDNDFTLQKMEHPDNSFEKRLKEVMHKAFWDVLEEKLAETPPDYTQALSLLQEVKTALLDLLLPQHSKLKAHINEVLDMELIRQKVNNDALDMQYYAEFVIGLMAQLCAPARDERVRQIKAIKEITPLFREIMTVLDLLKMDMANFTLKQIRPFVQQQSVDYERKKFIDFLKTQKEMNIDGLEFTRDWLVRNTDLLQNPDSPRDSHTSGEKIEVTPANIVNCAYLELLRWDSGRTFPETLVMDATRLSDCHAQLTRLLLTSSVLLVTYNTVGAPIAGIRELKQALKEKVMIIIADTPINNLSSVIENVADQVLQEVNLSLEKHHFPIQDEARQSLLRNQIKDITEPDNAVQTLIRKRIEGFVYQLLSTDRPERAQMPPGVSAVSEELCRICGQFIRIVSHNRAVFSSQYNEIIATILERSQQVD